MENGCVRLTRVVAWTPKKIMCSRRSLTDCRMIPYHVGLKIVKGKRQIARLEASKICPRHVGVTPHLISPAAAPVHAAGVAELKIRKQAHLALSRNHNQCAGFWASTPSCPLAWLGCTCLRFGSPHTKIFCFWPPVGLSTVLQNVSFTPQVP